MFGRDVPKDVMIDVRISRRFGEKVCGVLGEVSRTGLLGLNCAIVKQSETSNYEVRQKIESKGRI